MALILIIFILFSWYAGHLVVNRIVPKFPTLFLWAGAFLVGTAIAVPITYILSCLFVSTGLPILWGTIGTIVVLGSWLLVLGLKNNKKKETRNKELVTKNELLFIFFSLSFSSWLMFKTFHDGAAGQLFVGSNNVFDFGLSLGLIRSISYGANIPFGSPFSAGLPMFYHFFFPFYCALWEYFGIPIVWAVNGPSILAFSALLIIMYSLPEIVGVKGKLVGWIAVLLTITHPTITFWKYIMEKGLSIGTINGLWQIPTYPFAGPFDGSTISIFMTLNNYINQRHLAFAIALGLLFYVVVWNIIRQTKNIRWYVSIIIGCFAGGMFYWNVVICGAVALSLILLFVIYKQIKVSIVFCCTVGIVIIFSLIPYIPKIIELFGFAKIFMTVSSSVSQPSWSLWTYLWENFSLLPFVAGAGYITIRKEKRLFLPFIFIFIFVIFAAGYHHRGFDQKFLSFFIIPINILAAIGLVWIWNRKSFIVKVLSCVLFLVLTISGVVDLLAVKNEFAYPVISSENSSVISWIQQNTSKDAVFVSYSDMIDPVVLAGRRNYFGFFGNVGSIDRSSDVNNMYAGDKYLANNLGISYILVPKWNKSDFPYIVDQQKLRQLYPVAYEDEWFLIFDTPNPVIQ